MASEFSYVLPNSLCSTKTWPQRKANDRQTWVLSLDLAARSGGAVRAQLIEYARLGPVRWLWSGEPFDRESFNRDFAACTLSEAQLELLKAQSESREAHPEFDLQRWAKTVFTSALHDYGELALRTNVLQMLDHLSSEQKRSRFPLDVLRFLPMHLKLARSPQTQAADRDWLRTVVFLSPERDESTSLELHATSRVKLNPTLQLARSSAPSSRIELVYRSRGELHERDVRESEAALFDELLEEPSHVVADLVRQGAAIESLRELAAEGVVIVLPQAELNTTEQVRRG